MTRKYECRRCGNVRELNVKTANDVVRRRHACEECDDITTFERLDHNYDNLTDAQREFLRKMNPKVVVSSSNTSRNTLHIVDDGENLCEHNIDPRIVSINTYPLGFAEWCNHCLERTKNPTTEFECTTDEASVTKALEYAQEKADGKLTMRKYEAMNITPSSWTIKQVFGTWSNAVDEVL